MIKSVIKNLIPSYRIGTKIQFELETIIKEYRKNNQELIAKNQELIEDNIQLRHEIEVVRNEVRAIGWQHLGRFITYTAALETSKFIIENMSKVKSVETKFDLLSYALNEVSIDDGLYMEFGVFSGETINFISNKLKENNKIYGFDSFEGLPENWRTGYDESTFDRKGTLPNVNDNVVLVKGWFNETLPVFKKDHNQKVSFIHVDCDLYSSTVTIFEELKNQITSGTIIVFDEFFYYPDWQNGEYKAFMEFIKNNSLGFEYIGYSMIEQVAVRIK